MDGPDKFGHLQQNPLNESDFLLVSIDRAFVGVRHISKQKPLGLG
jgi:hypothetical protein